MECDEVIMRAHDCGKVRDAAMACTVTRAALSFACNSQPAPIRINHLIGSYYIFLLFILLPKGRPYGTISLLKYFLAEEYATIRNSNLTIEFSRSVYSSQPP